ncbi:hypothetical protein [Penaeicola halotolerans]|uniref:hypothetical protein n=1 Tax=Penaeicola halotolerans TaxID=2793196 RepID=UPI001CF81AB1|nr:hypothetical protein [Penaeicola halotolerans]
MKQLLLTFLIMLTGWVSTAQQVEQVRFFDNLKAYCGETFPGKVVHGNPFPGVTDMSITFEVCDETEIKIPFVVGENKSRTWILTMTADGIQLKHDHRHEDGTPDRITNYGGTSTEQDENKQVFPADSFTKELLPRSTGQIWTLSLDKENQVLTYMLHSNGRLYAQVDFDLKR